MDDLLPPRPMRLRVLASAGGTAGHVLPALSVLQQLSRMLPMPQKSLLDETSAVSDLRRAATSSEVLCGESALEALFVGEEAGMERGLVSREKINGQAIEFVPIKAGAMNGVGVVRQVRSALKLVRGVLRALQIVHRFKPDVVLLTGGFVGVPVSVAAWLKRVPSVVYLPDIEPGQALKLMARLATKVAATTEASAQFISQDKLVVTGYPVRAVFDGVTRERGRAKFNISQTEKVLLVFGGSKGARSINRAVLKDLPSLLRLTVVVHVSGVEDWAEVSAARAALTREQQARYLTFEYLHEEMADAMAAADLAVCRSGAVSLGELPFVGLPAVLVPYPYAWRFQKVNAAYVAERGAAVVLRDERLEAELVKTVTSLLMDDGKLVVMREAMLALGKRDGARRIAQMLLEQATGGTIRNRAHACD
jgi:UDP-N-acetylglucosamine--N-acetylmuramyl-(pentapeptide) pyrophosphoryl-undecaprenol N-acetylglucosamine transferase